jgi:hypothetical protein
MQCSQESSCCHGLVAVFFEGFCSAAASVLVFFNLEQYYTHPCFIFSEINVFEERVSDDFRTCHQLGLSDCFFINIFGKNTT